MAGFASDLWTLLFDSPRARFASIVHAVAWRVPAQAQTATITTLDGPQRVHRQFARSKTAVCPRPAGTCNKPIERPLFPRSNNPEPSILLIDCISG